MNLRKNQAQLSSEERKRFVDTVLALKASGKYDEYVEIHVNMGMKSHGGSMTAMDMSEMRHMIHRSPTFLPWHREMLRRFELDLQAIDSSVTVPYWDWTVDNQTTSSLWANDFMGGSGEGPENIVASGPFAFAKGQWTLNVNDPQFKHRELRRILAVDATDLPTTADVSGCLDEIPYDSPHWDTQSRPSFRNRLEGWEDGGRPQLHNLVHVWVGGRGDGHGGHMGYMASPNDPVFFLHHAQVDRIWAQWQAKWSGRQDYQPASGGPPGENKDDVIGSWDSTTTIADLLDHHALDYRYDDES